MRRPSEHSWTERLLRIALGLVFIYSSWSKISDPPGFAEVIWNYRILPGYLVNPIAITLPWLELLAGLALLFGFIRRGAALLAAGMLIIFIAALATDLVRGIAVDCGCFSVAAQSQTPSELFADMKIDLLRDVGLLGMAFLVLFLQMKPQSASLSVSPPGEPPT
jgi:uncharacterized membrane protein YphA (DoxX/SURF4 family)